MSFCLSLTDRYGTTVATCHHWTVFMSCVIISAHYQSDTSKQCSAAEYWHGIIQLVSVLQEAGSVLAAVHMRVPPNARDNTGPRAPVHDLMLLCVLVSEPLPRPTNMLDISLSLHGALLESIVGGELV